MSRLTLLLAAFLVIGLAACGGSATASVDSEPSDDAAPTEAPASTEAPGDGGGTGSIDLCTVLTIEEVSAAAGVEVTDTTTASSDGVSSCNYNTADGSPVAGSTLLTSESTLDPVQMFEANVEGSEDVPDVGDAAKMQGDDSFPILTVLVGDSLLSMSVLADNLDAAGKRQATIDLARLAADRLP